MAPLRNIFDEFKGHFQHGRPERGSADQEQAEAQETAYKEEIRDARAFVSTHSFRRYRGMLVAAIETRIPDPRGGMEAAAACSFTQAGLREALQYLDNIATAATEESDG